MARGRQFVENLLKEDVERFDQASDEEVNRQMAAENVVTTRVPSAEELLAKAAERAAMRPDVGARLRVVKARSKTSRVLRATWLIAAALSRLAVVMTGLGTGVGVMSPPPAHIQAAELREAAPRHCDRHEWRQCVEGLDEARKLDPQGDLDSSVVAARARAAGAMHALGADSGG